MAREIAGTSKVSSLRFDDESDDDAPAGGQSSKSAAMVKKPAKDTSRLFMKDDTRIQFYILKKDVAQSIVLDLENQIEACGGEVVPKLPIEGYALVDPRTEQGASYISARTTPTRRVVSFHFVKESVARGRLVPYADLTLFVKQDKPVKFHLHESLKRDEEEKLRDAILLRAGNPDAGLHEAQVVIHANDWRDKNVLGRRYKNVLMFETPQWLESCMARKRFALSEKIGRVPNQQSFQPGRKPGAPRNDFTEEDDAYLIAWIAHTFGSSTTGRKGNKPYKELVAEPRFMSWSHRHTWQSWRERYKTRSSHFDPLIAAHVARHGKTKKPKPTEEIVFSSSDGEEDASDGPPPDRNIRSKRKVKDTSSNADEESQSSESPKKKTKTNAGREEYHSIKVSASQKEQQLPPSPRAPSPRAPSPRAPTPQAPSSVPASPSPTPPPADEIFRQPSPVQAVPVANNTLDISDSQDDSQISTQVPSSLNILDAAISGLDAQGAMERHKAELAAFEGKLGDDPDVDVVGVTQQALPPPWIVPKLEAKSEDGEEASGEESEASDETATESIESKLAGLAAEYGVKHGLVTALFQQATAAVKLKEEPALDWVRRSLEEEDSTKKRRRKGKGRAVR